MLTSYVRVTQRFELLQRKALYKYVLLVVVMRKKLFLQKKVLKDINSLFNYVTKLHHVAHQEKVNAFCVLAFNNEETFTHDVYELCRFIYCYFEMVLALSTRCVYLYSIIQELKGFDQTI